MKSVGIAELKDRLSEHLRAVERGGEVVVMDRNRAIARIVPMGSPRPALTILLPSVSFSTVRSKKRRAARWKLNSAALLAEERSDR